MVKFFSRDEELQVIAAIKAAEARTSGEIRVHIAQKSIGEPLAAAIATFQHLKMYQTQQRNGVILYIVPTQKQFAVFGDNGIDAATAPDFWASTAAILQTYFRKGLFCEGVCNAVADIGAQLHQYFPSDEVDVNKNELSDDISYDYTA